jgi:GntR family transcriptional regulator
MILDGVLKEGDSLPSVRTVAAEYRVNPLTVLKGYQQLVDEGLVETKRGRGMFINAGARNLLMKGERQKFLAEEWPRIQETIQRLGLNTQELLGANGKPSEDPHFSQNQVEVGHPSSKETSSKAKDPQEES